MRRPDRRQAPRPGGERALRASAAVGAPAVPSSSSPPSAGRIAVAAVGGVVRFAGVIAGSSTLVRQVVEDLAALSRATPALAITFTSLDDDARACVDDAPGAGVPLAVRVDVSGPAAFVAAVQAFLVALDDV